MRVEKGGSIVYSGEGIFKCEWVWSGVEWSGVGKEHLMGGCGVHMVIL